MMWLMGMNAWMHDFAWESTRLSADKRMVNNEDLQERERFFPQHITSMQKHIGETAKYYGQSHASLDPSHSRLRVPRAETHDLSSGRLHFTLGLISSLTMAKSVVHEAYLQQFIIHWKI
jgi:hypothetical protein